MNAAKLAQIQLALCQNHRHAPPDDGRPQVRVGIVTAEIVLAMLLGEVQRLPSRMQIHPLAAAGGNDLLKHVHQILLKRLQARHGHVEGALLRDDRAGGVMRIHHCDALLHAGALCDFLHPVGHVVKGHRAVPGLHLKALSVNHIQPSHFFRSSAARRVAAIISSIIASGSPAFMMPEAAPAASDPAMMKSYTC